MAWATLRAVTRLGIAVLCLSTVDMPMRVLAGELYASNQEMLALFQNGEYEASIAVAERAVAEAKNAYGDNRPEYAIQLGKLAHSLMAANRISDAEPLLRRALQICSTALAPDHPVLADALDGTATAALWQGRLEEAATLLKRVYAIREQRIAADDPSFLDLVSRMSALYRMQGRNGESERVLREAIVVVEGKLGLSHPYVAPLLTSLAALTAMDRMRMPAPPADAEIDGPAARQKEREALMEEALKPGADLDAIMEKVFKLTEREMKEYDATVASLTKPDPLGERSAAILSQAIEAGVLNGSTKLVVGPMIDALSQLASTYKYSNRFAEAEQVYHLIGVLRVPAVNASYAAGLHLASQQMFTLDPNISLNPVSTKGFTPKPNWVLAKHGLLDVYEAQQRYAEFESTANDLIQAAEELARISEYAAIARSQKSAVIKRLIKFYVTQEKDAEVELYLKQELALLEEGSDPLKAADALTRVTGRDYLPGLADLYQRQGRLVEAEEALVRAVTIRTEVQGRSHPDVVALQDRIGRLRQPGNASSAPATAAGYGRSTAECSGFVAAIERWAEVQTEMRQHCSELEWNALNSLAQARQQPGDDAFGMQLELESLSQAAIEKRNWADAVAFLSQATEFAEKVRKRTGKPAIDLSVWSDANMHPVNRQLVLIKTAYRLAEEDRSRSPELLDMSFVAAQQAHPLVVAGALGQMASRQANGNTSLGVLIRERQDLGNEWKALDRQFAEQLKRSDQMRDVKADQRRRNRIQAIDARLAEIDKVLAKDFPEYKSLSDPEPLSIAQAQAHLRGDDALVQFIFTPPLGTAFHADVPSEAFIWVVTKTSTRWAKLEITGKALAEHIGALRCGLDQSNWSIGSATRERCQTFLQGGVSNFDLPPFDLSRAHALYTALFGDVRDLIAGKHLLIVPSGPFTTLPFAALVVDKPTGTNRSGLPDYQHAKWLGHEQPLSVLPSVASLEFLRERVKPSRASKPFIGFGNPLLDGIPGDSVHQERASLARQKTSCARTTSTLERLRITFGQWPVIKTLFRGNSSDVDALRQQLALPETADELCAVASKLGADNEDVRLGDNMTEAGIKKLSSEGRLRNFRVVHFATHGLVAGETELFTQEGVEPALMFTPPNKATAEDDGLLTASEVMDLQLDADWVVMSACNTAAGGAREAEALSGLARAFFYAGARSLLVSHWAVDSDAAVAITIEAFDVMKTSPGTGQAEALQHSIRRLAAKGGRSAHPAIWAPFALVGDGGG